MALRSAAPLPFQVVLRFRLDILSETRGRYTFILAADLVSIAGSPRSGATLFSFLALHDWVPFYFLSKDFNRIVHFFFHIDGRERRSIERRIRAIQS